MDEPETEGKCVAKTHLSRHLFQRVIGKESKQYLIYLWPH